MEAPVTLRLDAKTRRQIARIARGRRISKSEVIRLALNAWPEFHGAETSPYEAMADLIGIARGGDPNLSSNTGRKFKAIQNQKRKRS